MHLSVFCHYQNKPDRIHSKPTQNNSAHDATLFLDLWSRLYLLVDRWTPYHMPRTSKNPRALCSEVLVTLNPKACRGESLIKKNRQKPWMQSKEEWNDCEMCPVVNELQQKRLNTSDLWKSNSKSLWDGSLIVLPLGDQWCFCPSLSHQASHNRANMSQQSSLTEATWSKSRKLQRSHGANFMERFAHQLWKVLEAGTLPS